MLGGVFGGAAVLVELGVTFELGVGEGEEAEGGGGGVGGAREGAGVEQRVEVEVYVEEDCGGGGLRLDGVERGGTGRGLHTHGGHEEVEKHLRGNALGGHRRGSGGLGRRFRSVDVVEDVRDGELRGSIGGK